MTDTLRQILDQVLEERSLYYDKHAKPLVDAAQVRELKPEERAQFVEIERHLQHTDDRVSLLRQGVAQEEAFTPEILRALGSGGTQTQTRDSKQWINTDTGEPASLRSDQSFAEHRGLSVQPTAADADSLARFENIGEMVRALATGGGGSAIVPQIWASGLIDRAREESVVTKAGAAWIPMEAKTVNIGRLLTDPTSAFRDEGSDITESDPTFDNVTLTAKTQSSLVVGSLEWFQDADNAATVVQNSIAQAIGFQIDQVAMYGGIESGAGSIDLPTPPNPRGILAALNATKPGNVIGAATNGTAQDPASFWAEILDLIYTVRDNNETPSAIVWNSKAGRQYAKAVDTTGQPLQKPPDVNDVLQLTSNKIPSYTKGTMTSRATDVFAGDFSQLLIGQRLGITIQVLTEKYADTGQIGIVAHWRGDVQPARPGAFAVYRAIQGAA